MLCPRIAQLWNRAEWIRRREHYAMGRCPDCGARLTAHRLFRHGTDQRPWNRS